jgi:thiamine-monophosphate kinase
MLPPEFTLIARYFAPLAGPAGLGLLDDAAVFTPPPGRALVITADAMVAGVHFPPDDPPHMIGQKLLRVNLSDVAAMGATPFGYMLTVSAPRGTPEAWFAAFAAGLAADQASYGIQLLGGDTTSTPGPISLSVTMLGHVAPGQAWRRSGARAGDDLWVTGTIGDGVLGLAAVRGEIADPGGTLADRYRLPQPRLGLGLALQGPAPQEIVHAAMDVSDGLVQDSGHMARASGVALCLETSLVPVSAAGRAAGPRFVESGTAGGDDYELLLAVPPDRQGDLMRIARQAGIAVTRIGRFSAGAPEVTGVRADGSDAALGGGGWSHF